MKNYDVCFLYDNIPGEATHFIVKAENEFQAVSEANYAYFNSRKNRDFFLVKETKESEMKTAQNWYTPDYKLIDAQVSGYKQVVTA